MDDEALFALIEDSLKADPHLGRGLEQACSDTFHHLTRPGALNAEQRALLSSKATQSQAYIRRVSRRLRLDDQRRERRRQAALRTVASEATAPSAETEAIRNELSRRLRSLIGSLPQDEQAPVLLELDGLGKRDIAAHLGCTYQAVRSKLHRIKLRLRTLATPL